MLTYGFFDSSNGDRKYTSTQMSEIFDGIIEDGVYSNVGEALAVVPGTGLQVVVKTGRAWFKHTWTLNNAYLPLNIENPDPYRSRIDAVILEVNHNLDVRANSITILKGSASASATKPTLLHENGIDQYALAYVTVDPGVNEIVASKIEIAVGKNETPFVQCPLRTVSIQDLFNQWQGEFDEWFDNVKATLTDNVVTNLQRQIDERVKIADKATTNDVKLGTPNKWLDPTVFANGMYYNTAPVGAVIRDPGVNLAELYPTKYRELDGGIIRDPPEAIKEKYFGLGSVGQVWNNMGTPLLYNNFGYSLLFENWDSYVRRHQIFINRNNFKLYVLEYFKDRVGAMWDITLQKPAGATAILFSVVYDDTLLYVMHNMIIGVVARSDLTVSKFINLKTIVSGVTYNAQFDLKNVDFVYMNGYAHIVVWDTAGKQMIVWYSNNYFQTVGAKTFSIKAALTNNRILPFIFNTGTEGGMLGTESAISAHKLHEYENKCYFMLPNENNSGEVYKLNCYEFTPSGPSSTVDVLFEYTLDTAGSTLTNILQHAVVMAVEHDFVILFRQLPATFTYGEGSNRRVARMFFSLKMQRPIVPSTSYSIQTPISPSKVFRRWVSDMDGYISLLNIDNQLFIFCSKLTESEISPNSSRHTAPYTSLPSQMGVVQYRLDRSWSPIINSPLNNGYTNSTIGYVREHVVDGYLLTAASLAKLGEVHTWFQAPSKATYMQKYSMVSDASPSAQQTRPAGFSGIAILDLKKGRFDIADLINIDHNEGSMGSAPAPNMLLTDDLAFYWTNVVFYWVDRRELRLPKEPGTYIAIS